MPSLNILAGFAPAPMCHSGAYIAKEWSSIVSTYRIESHLSLLDMPMNHHKNVVRCSMDLFEKHD